MLGCTDTEPRVCITVLAEGGQDKASVAVVTCWVVQFFFCKRRKTADFFLCLLFPDLYLNVSVVDVVVVVEVLYPGWLVCRCGLGCCVYVCVCAKGDSSD